VAVMLGLATTSGAALARGGHGGGGHGGGRFGMPLISVPSNTVPQFNASSPYTVAPAG
jgi:hypothetical protein